MNKSVRSSVNLLVICLVIISVAAGMARLIETDYGKVEVNNVTISDPNGVMLSARLYRPVTATVDHKAPAVINIHGYQNDKLTDDSYSIELSRRGFVVIATDVIGHGDSGGGLSVGGLLGDPTYTGGMQSVFQYTKELQLVDTAKIGVMGHSMGAILTQ
ncbi:MAG: CocE/NonD family hydrolase, partial [Chloroflexota bacterium]